VARGASPRPCFVDEKKRLGVSALRRPPPPSPRTRSARFGTANELQFRSHVDTSVHSSARRLPSSGAMGFEPPTLNLYEKLRARERASARPGAHVHRSRAFYESVFPNHTVRPRTADRDFSLVASTTRPTGSTSPPRRARARGASRRPPASETAARARLSRHPPPRAPPRAALTSLAHSPHVLLGARKNRKRPKRWTPSPGLRMCTCTASRTTAST
jgi:hypothetical protein